MDEKKATSTNTTTDDDGKSKKDTDDKDKVATTEKKDDSTSGSNKKEKEPDSEQLHNPTRVVKAQVYLCFFFFQAHLISDHLLATFDFITQSITLSTN